MTVIIDYKLGNQGSVYNMLKYLGHTCEITSDVSMIQRADKLILSGVGSFDAGVRNLHKLGLFDVIKHKVNSENTPILGICLGMQLLGSASEEGVEAGLGLIKGESVKFLSGKVRIPHMGWAELKIKRDCMLFENNSDFNKFYFAHSYHFIPEDYDLVVAESFYGDIFVAALECNNIMGVQFHPEKSHKFGLRLLNRFISVC